MTPLPCPFCGANAGVEVSEGSTFRWVVAVCNKCGAQSPEARVNTMAPANKEEDETAAIAEWNTRNGDRGIT